MKILDMKYVPHPIALQALRRAKVELEAVKPHLGLGEEALSSMISGNVIDTTRSYLTRFSKCTPEKAEKAFEKLKEVLNNEYEAAVMINIKPRVPEEAADILRLLRRSAPDPELASKVVDILLEICG